MLLILMMAAALAAADPAPTAAAPPPADKDKAEKPPQNCTSKKVGRLFGHDVTHVKCDDAKPARAEPAAAKPSEPT